MPFAVSPLAGFERRAAAQERRTRSRTSARRCGHCHRTPLIGERIYLRCLAASGSSASSAGRCAARLRTRIALVHAPEHAARGPALRRLRRAGRILCCAAVDPVDAAITIDRPREEVFDYLADIANHPEFTDHYLKDWRLTRVDSYGPRRRRALPRRRAAQPLLVGRHDLRRGRAAVPASWPSAAAASSTASRLFQSGRSSRSSRPLRRPTPTRWSVCTDSRRRRPRPPPLACRSSPSAVSRWPRPPPSCRRRHQRGGHRRSPGRHDDRRRRGVARFLMALDGCGCKFGGLCRPFAPCLAGRVEAPSGGGMDSNLFKTKSIEQLVGDVEHGSKALKRSLTALGPDAARHRRHHRHRHLRAHRHGRGQPGRPGDHDVVSRGGPGVRVRGALLRRVRLDDSDRRQRLHLRLRDAGRAGRLDDRLGPDPRVRRRLDDRGDRLERLHAAAAVGLRHHAAARRSAAGAAGRRHQPAGGADRAA